MDVYCALIGLVWCKGTLYVWRGAYITAGASRWLEVGCTICKYVAPKVCGGDTDTGT